MSEQISTAEADRFVGGSNAVLVEMLQALQAVKEGDFTVRLRADWSGLPGKIADVFNDIVSTNQRMAEQLQRVGHVVGKEGLTNQRVKLGLAHGAWGEMQDSVNALIDDLLQPTAEVTRTIAAVAQGDLRQPMRLDVDGRPLQGEFLRSATIVNTMIKQLSIFTSEVTRVAREVGTDGKLGGQAQISEVTGVWKDLTDSVNSMASNLTAQVRNIAEVTIAVANGDLSKKITVDVRGEILLLKEAINTMVEQLRSFAAEVTRVAREVGTEGRLGGQAVVPGVGGTWKDLTDNVNLLAANLTTQVRNIAEVTTAVARGDLSRKITVDVKGEILELKDTINTMVDQLNGFASEVTRVAREVGTEGRLGGQATVPGVAGTWKDLTDNVNSMAGNLTGQVRNIADVATAIARGDLSKKITVNVSGEILQLKETINTMVDQLNGFASEVTRVAREVGTEGKLGGQADVRGVAGTWKDLTDSVNSMASNLTTQVRNIAEVSTAIASGDLSKKIEVDAQGEVLELKETINTMVDQLNAFAGEVTRVAREVGTEGRLSGQAVVPGVGGTWKDLTDNVNLLAANLTTQVRNIAEVTTAVARGDLSRKITVDVKGEILELKNTINTMVDQLNGFASEVTRVAREVGTEGRLGGQAKVPGAAGTWKDLTGNVNLLADNLTNQVRAIAEVTTAVTKGDLTRSIQVEARGEVAELKDYINTMIGNLRLTTERNTEQDWLKTNLARFTSMLQGQRDLATVGRTLLSELVPLVNAHRGVIYQFDPRTQNQLKLLARYADDAVAGYPDRIELGSGLIGQCALEKQRRLLSNIPSTAVAIDAVVFKAAPRSVVVLPITFEDRIKAVISLSSLHDFEPAHLTFLEQLTMGIGIVLNSIEATMQTEELLMQSQELAGELQEQQKALQKTNEELAQKAQQLAERNVEVERKNEEIDQARRAVEEKAAELALTSRYKSEFLANMSHELRTPLNSILILGQQLGDNPDGNLSERQVEFARTIHGAGTDLLNLISDILDLSKIESGTVSVEAEQITFSGVLEAVARPFRHEAERRELAFEINFDADLGRTLYTDARRLQQVLKNLLSNAFKFTRQGHVRLSVRPATAKWGPDHPALAAAPTVVAFEVDDSGIGIPADKQKLIFEAFQQADASTSRKYGGTGLGLAISRELAHLLGGEIQLRSESGKGSTFTLYIPLHYVPPVAEMRLKMNQNSAERAPVRPAPSERLEDDRDRIAAGDQVLLIVEDDPRYAKIIFDAAHKSGFKGIVCLRGADVLPLATDYNPTAISLDIHLPDVLGWSVLSQLKHNPLTRHIPVQVVTLDDDRHHGLARGAFSYLTKPLQPEALVAALRRIMDFAKAPRKRLLIVDDDPAERVSLTELLHSDDIEILTAADGAGALKMLQENAIDCVALDLKLPDMSGFQILEQMCGSPAMRDIPVVVFTGHELSSEEDGKIRQLARTIVVKGVESPERLLDETALFLHRVIAELPAEKRELLSRLHDSDDYLKGRKVLLVDDDARNIFALSSLLERRGMDVLTATTGREAIETLNSTDVSLVLMDIMMPEMDGYQTMRRIRGSEKHQRLPIIALTAKAMKGDREKCLEAGASDYLAKPVDTEQLLSALRMWLHR
jgi:CheY-like chemotaxis protein/signal transduction histidine kinase/HAMP domain-containing protein